MEPKLVVQKYWNTTVLTMLNENYDVQITPWKSSQDMVILRREDEIHNV